MVHVSKIYTESMHGSSLIMKLLSILKNSLRTNKNQDYEHVTVTSFFILQTRLHYLFQHLQICQDSKFHSSYLSAILIAHGDNRAKLSDK